ncbi:hypothetical protein [Vibrio tarriae]|uniref:hypothetical protein n=1 Tax=Vibrio tarriae TaxID=2014742 RepID=UPI000DE4168F|nr:hypothetical protein [Vibrio tarriae]RBM24821.1 hypothetical protein DLR61_18660 [Vibrio tarriae]
MNHWKLIWESYYYNATLRGLFFDIVKYASWFDRGLVLIAFISVVVSLILVFTSTLFNAIWAVAIGEIILFARLPALKNRLIEAEFGDKDNSFLPHDDHTHQESRYLLFKRSLKSKHITSSHVNDCFDLVDTQIDIASTSGVVLKRFSSFSAGVFLGFCAIVWRKLDSSGLIYVGASLIALCLLIMLVLLMVPTKLERFKELKYFMQLYCKELHN